MKNNGYMNKKFKKKKSKEPQGMPFNEPTQQEVKWQIQSKIPQE